MLEVIQLLTVTADEITLKRSVGARIGEGAGLENASECQVHMIDKNSLQLNCYNIVASVGSEL